jgi:hypothetical protein
LYNGTLVICSGSWDKHTFFVLPIYTSQPDVIFFEGGIPRRGLESKLDRFASQWYWGQLEKIARRYDL